jgi:hypothetical protein
VSDGARPSSDPEASSSGHGSPGGRRGGGGRATAIVFAALAAVILVVVGLEWPTIAVQYHLSRLRDEPNTLATRLRGVESAAAEEALQRFVDESSGATELLRNILAELDGWYVALWPKPELLVQTERLVFGLGRKQPGDGPPTHFAYSFKGGGRSTQYTQSRDIPPSLIQLWQLVHHASATPIELPDLPGLTFTRLAADDPRAKEPPSWPLKATTLDSVYLVESRPTR